MTTHRSFTPQFKAQVVLEVLTGVRGASEAYILLSKPRPPFAQQEHLG